MRVENQNPRGEKMAKNIGRQSVKFEKDIYIKCTCATVGTKEGEGPLGKYFDRVLEDNLNGAVSWEEAESSIIKENVEMLIKKADMKNSEIDYIVSGDLLNQCCASTYGLRETEIPFLGVFGACSTMGEAMSVAGMIIESGAAENIIAGASSHFCSAEKQFRFPLELGNQRPPTSTWTVTGAGAVVLTSSKEKGLPVIEGITTGKIIDMGITDANNMGAAMAPAAVDLILNNFKDFGINEDYYDLIITGDLGYVGKDITIKMLKEKGYDISGKYTDCGIEIFDRDNQDTHSGGSGCACSASVFSAYFYEKLKKGELKRVLFIPTGALMSPTSVQQGESIAGIAHGVMISL